MPRIGNHWGACDPAEPRNRRRRASILVEHEGTRILVDTSPDLREQLLEAGVERLDAVIWTHDHADHCHGIDDLRAVFHARGGPVPGWARAETLATLRARFGYAFEGQGGYPAVVDGLACPTRWPSGPIRCGGGPAARRHHQRGPALRGDAASIGYSTDCNELTDDMARCSKASTSGSSMRCAAGRIRPIRISRDAALD